VTTCPPRASERRHPPGSGTHRRCLEQRWRTRQATPASRRWNASLAYLCRKARTFWPPSCNATPGLLGGTRPSGAWHGAVCDWGRHTCDGHPEVGVLSPRLTHPFIILAQRCRRATAAPHLPWKRGNFHTLRGRGEEPRSGRLEDAWGHDRAPRRTPDPVFLLLTLQEQRRGSLRLDTRSYAHQSARETDQPARCSCNLARS